MVGNKLVKQFYFITGIPYSLGIQNTYRATCKKLGNIRESGLSPDRGTKTDSYNSVEQLLIKYDDSKPNQLMKVVVIKSKE